MDLTSMMRDTSLTNLEWLNNAETYIPQDKDIDQKDNLEVEWGGGASVSSLELPRTTIEDEMDIIDSSHDVSTLLEYVNVLLHQGITREQIMQQAKFRFPPETISEAGSHLEEAFQMEGIVGCVAIDLRGRKKHKAIIQAAAKSPWKKHIAYVLMDENQADGSSFVSHRCASNTSLESGSIESFFAAEESEDNSQAIYEPLDLPVITSREDLDDEYYDQTMIDLVNVSGVTEDEAKEIYVSSGDAYEKLRSTFRLAMIRRDAVKEQSSSAKDRSAEYAAYSLDGTVGEIEYNDVEVAEPVSITETSSVPLEIAMSDAISDLDLEDSPSGMSVVELDDEPEDEGEIDIEPNTFIEEEFVGGDEIEFDDIIAPSQLDVSPYGSIDL